MVALQAFILLALRTRLNQPEKFAKHKTNSKSKHVKRNLARGLHVYEYGIPHIWLHNVHFAYRNICEAIIKTNSTLVAFRKILYDEVFCKYGACACINYLAKHWQQILVNSGKNSRSQFCYGLNSQHFTWSHVVVWNTCNCNVYVQSTN